MKQGSSSTKYEPKTEPVPKAINPGAADMLGQSVHFIKPDLNDGRGFTAPKDSGRTIHNGGSQGRH